MKSVILLLKSTLESDRLSLLALGSKHFHGLDGVPQDFDQSYYYYMRMASIAEYEYYNPIPDENYPDFVRLNDKEDLDRVMNEDSGDVFEWLKDRAKKGVISAQV